MLDETHTYLTFQGDPFNTSIVVRLNIQTGLLDQVYPKAPTENKVIGGQLFYRNHMLYHFYAATNEGQTTMNLVTVDPDSGQNTGDYKNILNEFQIPYVVGDEVHFWTMSESTGELSVSIFTLPN